MTSTNDINELIRTTIQTQVLTALKTVPEALDELVKAALSKEVDLASGRSDGSGYYHAKKGTYLDYIVGETIRHAAHQAVREAIQDRLPEIKAAVKTQLSNDKIVDSFAEAVLGVAGQDWKLSVKFERDRD